MTRSPRARRAAWLAFALLSVSQAASALPPECPTFFPDFSCDREARYPGFVPPITAPYLFEDPFITTGLSGWYIWHQFPGGSILDGGDIQIAALQARVAITDRLAFIATKDGYAWYDPGLDIIDTTNGWFNIAAGFKYALVQIPEHNFILTPALRFEIPVGQERVYSGFGDGIFIPSVSAAWGIGDFHVIGSLGSQLPVDMGDQSTQVFYNLHLDYAVWEHFVPLVELNGYTYTNSGNGKLPVKTDLGTLKLKDAQAALGKGGEEGLDALNLGSQGVAGDTVVTFAVGARIPITKHVGIGAAYEFPITNREFIFNQRVTANVLLEF
jgi:hypothetical protein